MRAVSVAPRRRTATAVIGAVSLLLVLLTMPAASADPGDPIVVPDEVLLECINEEIDPDRDTDEIVTKGEAEALTRIDCTGEVGSKIGDLTGLEHFVNLTELRLESFGIVDISALSGLTSLTWLILRDNDVTNLTPLAGMTSLGTLNLFDNNVEDLGPLAGLTELTILNLASNNIEDLTPLDGMNKLLRVWLNSNQIAEVTPLAGKSTLEHLNVDGNHIVDASPLQDYQSFVLVRDQTRDLGDVEIGVPQANPVIGFDGSPIALDGLYDSSGNTFTPTEAGPTEVGWESGEPEPRFFGTLAFNPVAGDGPPSGDPGDDDPGDTDPGDTDPGDTDPPGQSEPPSTPTPEPPTEPADPTDTDPPDEADPETVQPTQPDPVDPPTDVGAEVGAEGAETAGSGTLPVTGGRQGVMALVALTLVAVGAMASSFGRPFRNQNSSASRS